MNTKQKQKSAALKFVNQVRKILGKSPISKLPVGIPTSAAQCPLSLGIDDYQVLVTKDAVEFSGNPVKAFVVGKALGYDVNVDTYSDALVLDKEVKKFVNDFDNCKYPELVNIPMLVEIAEEFGQTL